MNETWRSEALKTLEAIFRDIFLDDRLKINEATSPAEIEEWDSLAHINLLAAVESQFNVRFTAEDMGRINNVSILLSVLAERGADSASV